MGQWLVNLLPPMRYCFMLFFSSEMIASIFSLVTCCITTM